MKLTGVYIYLHNDVIDGNVNQFDEESNEAHYTKANSSGDRNLLKFCRKRKTKQMSLKINLSIIPTFVCKSSSMLHTFAIRLGASFDKTHAVFGELPAGLDEHLDLIHFSLRMCLTCKTQRCKGFQ